MDYWQHVNLQLFYIVLYYGDSFQGLNTYTHGTS